MATKIRRATLSVNGSGKSAVVNLSFQDAHEFDRRGADSEFAGTPVEMRRGGSGTIELLSGTIGTGYATADMVATYNEVAVSSGTETVTQYTETFTGVTFNEGMNVDNDAGPGSRSINFEYSTRTRAAVGG